jgi:hypothetical protein
MVNEIAYFILVFIIPYIFIVLGLGFPLQTWIIHDRWGWEFWYDDTSDFKFGLLVIISPITVPIVLFIDGIYWVSKPIYFVISRLGASYRKGL